jgi:DNA-binding protein HU-beta
VNIGSTKADAKKAVNAFLETVTETLKSGDKVIFTGFGSFEVNERAAKEGRNPQTGEAVQIKATKAPKFKAGERWGTLLAIYLKCLNSVHPETPDETLLVSNSETRIFSSWQGNREVVRRRTSVRRTSKPED